jgi:hypothetical protein
MNLEKDSGNLRLLVSLWDEGGGTPWQLFYRGAKVWPAGLGRWPAHVAKSSPICPQGAVVEIKRKIEGKEEKKGGRWLTAHKSLAKWPQLASTQLPLSFFTTSCSSHAHSTDPKASKVKQISFIFFQSSIYFFLKFLDFMICNDAINKFVVGKE